jgi:hypothetical protein
MMESFACRSLHDVLARIVVRCISPHVYGNYAAAFPSDLDVNDA